MAPAMRDLFRSTAMHNTVVLDGRPQSAPADRFTGRRARTRGASCGTRSATSTMSKAFTTAISRRRMRGPCWHCTALGWLVIDHVLGPPGVSVTADTFWHIHPAWALAPADGSVLSDTPTARRVRSRVQAVCARSARPKRIGLDRYSPAYGRIEAALCLTTRTAAPVPHTVATFISGVNTSAVPVLEQLRVNVPPPTGWHGVAFRLRWRDGEAVVLSAIESSAVVSSAGSPGAIWGCELATTDARMAVIPLGNDRRLTPVLIHGTQIEPVAGPTRA